VAGVQSYGFGATSQPASKAPGMARRYAFGLFHLAIYWAGEIPSQRLRRTLLRHVFGLGIAPGAVLYQGCRIRAPKKILIASGTSVGDRATLDGRGGLHIGSNVNISSDVMIWTAQHDYDDPEFPMVVKLIAIDDYAWIGPRVILLPGAHIAEGVVVAAGAVVRGETEPYGLYAGIPAKRIGERSRGATYVPAAGYTPFI
jgi:acetyltransferase-like isoleucine patch superfamily enzyme